MLAFAGMTHRNGIEPLEIGTLARAPAILRDPEHQAKWLKSANLTEVDPTGR